MEALIEIEIEIETQVETQAETETETKLTCETRTEINKKAQCFWLTLCDSLSALFKLHNSATNNEMLFVCLFFWRFIVSLAETTYLLLFKQQLLI